MLNVGVDFIIQYDELVLLLQFIVAIVTLLIAYLQKTSPIQENPQTESTKSLQSLLTNVFVGKYNSVPLFSSAYGRSFTIGKMRFPLWVR